MPGALDTLDYYFRVVRGELQITSGLGGVDLYWERQDRRDDIDNHTEDPFINPPGGTMTFGCLQPFAVIGGQIDTTRTETYVVRASRSSLRDSTNVTLSPGQTTRVELFPVAGIVGNVTFSDLPAPPYPSTIIDVFPAGTTDRIGGIVADSTGVFRVRNIPSGTFDVRISSGGYSAVSLLDVTVSVPNDTDLGTILLTRTPAATPTVQGPIASDPLEVPRPTDVRAPGPARRGGAAPQAASTASLFRAEGDLTTVWRLNADPVRAGRAELVELFGSRFQIQNPALSEDLGGVRYVAYVSNESGTWQLYVQRLQDWQLDGDPVLIQTPGSTDNLACRRDVFHPHWVPGEFRLLVAMGDCPGNGFEDLGIDDNPWAVGEIRLWEVSLPPGL